MIDLSALLTLQQQYSQHGWRLPLWCQGSDSFLTAVQQQVVQQYQHQRIYWLGTEAPDTAHLLKPQQKQLWLGSECDVLIIDGRQQLDWELLAASAGCLKAGGLWLLCTPPAQLWLQQANPASKRVLSYPQEARLQPGRFQQLFIDTLVNSRCLHWREGEPLPTMPITSTRPPCDTTLPTAPFKTIEQQHAAAAVHKMLSGHRRRPLLICADRGRGKSTALGLVAAELVQQGKTPVLVTAPSPQAAAQLLQTAAGQLAETWIPGQQQLAQGQLQFVALDQLVAESPKAALVLVDEAAAIPTPLLQQLTQHYSRIVFASTEHGYEGTGRGFQLRFRHYLQQHNPGFREVRLEQPIRYQRDDPLEDLVFDAFLLRPPADPLATQESKPLHLQRYSNRDLQQQPALLRQVFHLLSLAHYQTDILDLWGLIEQQQLLVFCLQQQQHVQACALVSLEGSFDQNLLQQIYQGKRRVQGHLLAQSLAYHCMAPQLAEQTVARVQRIVVHPQWQQQGYGSRLLAALEHSILQDGIALIGASFGATTELVQFWQKAGYSAVKLAQQPHQASAEYSVLMVKALAKTSAALCQQLSDEFAHNLYWQLSHHYQSLSAAVIAKLCRPPQQLLTLQHQQQLHLLCQQQRHWSECLVALRFWLNQHADNLPESLLLQVIPWLWQHKNQSLTNLDYQLLLSHIAASLQEKSREIN